MMLSIRRPGRAATLLLLHSLLSGCFAQTQPAQPAKAPMAMPSQPNDSSVEYLAVLKVVRKAYETPTQTYLCPGATPNVRSEVRSRLADVFSDEILDGFISQKARCEVLASARYGFGPLDTHEAIKQTYSLTLSEPLHAHGETIVEVRFHPLIKGKPGAEGGAIVYLKKIEPGWRIANIESVDQLGTNGFQSLIQNYPSVSSDAWADMDYSKSLSHPTPRQ